MRITVQTAGGSHCDISPCDHWTCHDLKIEIQQKLDVRVAQQRLIHGTNILEEFMSTAAIETIGQLFRLEAGQDMLLE
eukprot:268039-Heterocapsa_arctica.AAC.1